MDGVGEPLRLNKVYWPFSPDDAHLVFRECKTFCLGLDNDSFRKCPLGRRQTRSSSEWTWESGRHRQAHPGDFYRLGTCLAIVHCLFWWFERFHASHFWRNAMAAYFYSWLLGWYESLHHRRATAGWHVGWLLAKPHQNGSFTFGDTGGGLGRRQSRLTRQSRRNRAGQNVDKEKPRQVGGVFYSSALRSHSLRVDSLRNRKCHLHGG